MSDALIDKADSLMRRHRVANAPLQASALPPGPADGRLHDAEDLPLLTDVVAPPDGPPPATAAHDIEDLLRDRLAAALPQQREQLRRELANWLDDQLPQLVMRVLDGVTDQMVAQINTQARMTLLPKLQSALDAGKDQASPPVADD